MSLLLLVDDEPAMGGLVAMSLERVGVRVVQAATVEEAMSLSRQEQPRAILLDLALGSEDGLSLLPRLKADPVLSDVPVVAFSVHDSRREEAFRCGVAAFLAKPFDPPELRNVVLPLVSAS
ncbi:MAG: response regulator [Actinomycetota bacterium]